jgi:hypothetical protein
MILMFDNVVTPSYAKALEGMALNAQFYYLPKTTSEQHDTHSAIIDENVRDNGQFICQLFAQNKPQTEVFMARVDPLIYTLMDLLKDTDFAFKDVHRVKVNMLVKDVGFCSYNYNEPHVDNNDSNQKATSIIYYANDSDGETVFFNEFYSAETQKLTVAQRVMPKRNRIAVFDSERYHASSNPIANGARTVINFVVY